MRVLHSFSLASTHACTLADTNAEANVCADRTPNARTISAAIHGPDEHSHQLADRSSQSYAIICANTRTKPTSHPVPDIDT